MRMFRAPVETARRNSAEDATQRTRTRHTHQTQGTYHYIPKSTIEIITMNNAELYQTTNSLQKRDALLCLDEYAPKMKWKKDVNRILDIGCGDGSVTNMLKNYIPTEFKILGCDISEKMVNFANRHHCNEMTSFTVMDIEGDLPAGLRGAFDHVFSFYALHWIINQRRAFTNIYELLSGAGDCFMIFVAGAPVFDVYRILARSNKWSSWMKELDRYISPYHDSREPDKEIRKMMENIGFVGIDVQCKEMGFMYDNLEMAKKALTAVNPFTIPKDLYDDFMEDYMEVVKQMQLIDKANNNHSEAVKFTYRLLVVYGQKPTSRDKTQAELHIK